MTDNGRETVTEPEACAAYIAMRGKRSVYAVRKAFIKDGWKAPSERMFSDWCAKNRWIALAREHDHKIVTETAAKIAKAAVAEAVSRADQFDTLATESLKKAIDGLALVDVATLKVQDIRALVEVSERTSKMFELLEGRATDRTDHVTREKMDALMKEMGDEIDERMAQVNKTVH